MSQVYNPESDLMEEIERLELEARDLRRKIEHLVNEQDRRVMNRQLQELEEQVSRLQSRLPH
jgi:predicted nuclease with TOPRIM domain